MRYRRILMGLFSILLLVPQVPMVTMSETTNNTVVPDPLYHWGFEEDEVNGNAISNEVNRDESSDIAELQGDASLVEDEKRGNVLHLSGDGWLSLPENLYKDVSDELTVMMWAK